MVQRINKSPPQKRASSAGQVRCYFVEVKLLNDLVAASSVLLLVAT